MSRALLAAEVAAALGERAVVAADPAGVLEAVRRLDGTVLVCGSVYLMAAFFAAPRNEHLQS